MIKLGQLSQALKSLTIATDESESGFNYNPITQKPVELPPIGRQSGYHYFGPPPDAGFSYGKFKDQGGNFIATIRGEQMSSPYDGQPMEYVEDIPLEEIMEMLKDSSTMDSVCPQCATPMMSDLGNEAMSSMEALHCVTCGSPVPEALHAQSSLSDLINTNWLQPDNTTRLKLIQTALREKSPAQQSKTLGGVND